MHYTSDTTQNNIIVFMGMAKIIGPIKPVVISNKPVMLDTHRLLLTLEHWMFSYTIA